MKYKQLYLSLILLLHITVGSAHSFKIGLFELRPAKDGVSVYARFDRFDMLKVLQANCNDYNHLDQCFESYVNEHVSFNFDGQQSTIKYEKHEFNDDFVEVYFTMDVKSSTVANIEIFNDCLLDLDDNQQNIVYLYFNNMRRTFRLDKDRLRTTVEY